MPEDLTAEDKRFIKRLRERAESSDVSRRDLLQLGGATGLGALLGAGGLFGMTGGARAGTAQVGTLGEPNDPLDIVIEDAFGPGGQGSGDAVAFEAVNNPNYIEPQVPTSEGSSYNADLSTGNYHKVTLTGDVTFDFTNVNSSDVNSLVLHLVQDGTGGRTPSFTPTIVWDGGSVPSWSTSAGAEDVVTFVHDQDGSKWLGFVGGLGMA